MGERIAAPVTTKKARKKNLFVHAFRDAPSITNRFQPTHNIELVNFTQAFADKAEINWALGEKQTILRNNLQTPPQENK